VVTKPFIVIVIFVVILVVVYVVVPAITIRPVVIVIAGFRLVCLGRVRLGLVCLGRVRLGFITLGRVRPRLGLVCLWRVRLGFITLGLVRPRLGFITLGRARPRIRLRAVVADRCGQAGGVLNGDGDVVLLLVAVEQVAVWTQGDDGHVLSAVCGHCEGHSIWEPEAVGSCNS
jgi:hypothetical protein